MEKAFCTSRTFSFWRLKMRKLFFFSIGLAAAVSMTFFFSQDEASSRRRRVVRPPQLRATILFPKTEKMTLLGVSFSHASHARLGHKNCEDCHNDTVFSKEQKMGINKITMDAIYDKKFCGHCHNGETKNKEGEPVFAPNMSRVPHCNLCHNVKIRKPEGAAEEKK